MSVDERIRRYRQRYFSGLVATICVAGVIAGTRKNPSRALAVAGAATGATVAYAAISWPRTKRVATEAAAQMLTDQVQGLFK